MFDTLTTSFSSFSFIPIRLLAATGVRISGKAKLSPSMREKAKGRKRTKDKDWRQCGLRKERTKVVKLGRE